MGACEFIQAVDGISPGGAFVIVGCVWAVAACFIALFNS